MMSWHNKNGYHLHRCSCFLQISLQTTSFEAIAYRAAAADASLGSASQLASDKWHLLQEQDTQGELPTTPTAGSTGRSKRRLSLTPTCRAILQLHAATLQQCAPLVLPRDSLANTYAARYRYSAPHACQCINPTSPRCVASAHMCNVC